MHWWFVVFGVFGVEFPAVGFACFVLTSIVCLMVVGVVMGIDGLHETGRFSTFCTVNVAHAFPAVSCCLVFVWFVMMLVQSFLSSVSIWAEATCSGVLLSAVCAFQCQFFVVLALVGVMSSCAIYAGLDFRLACPGMVTELLAIEVLLKEYNGYKTRQHKC